MSRRAGLWVGGWALALLVAYALAGFLWVPRAVHSRVLETIEREYGRKASLERPSFNPFTFEFEARAFSLPDTDGARMLGFERLYVDFDSSSLWRRAWSFGAIELEQPYLRLVQQADGALNLAQLRTREPDAATAGSAAVPALVIDRLAIAGGQVDVLDHRRPEPFATALRPITFSLENFASRGDGGAFEFSAGSDRAGRLVLQGTVEVAPFASRGTIGLTGLTAETITDYLGGALPVSLRAGRIDLRIGYDFSLAGTPFTLVLEVPSASARDLVTVARGYEESWTVPALELRDGRVDLAARSVSIAAIEARDISGPAWLDAEGFHAPGAVPRREAAAPARPDAGAEAPRASSQPRWRLDMPDIRIANSTIALEDRRRQPAKALPVTIQELRVGRFAWPAQDALTLAASAVLATGGALGLEGELRLQPVALAAELTLADVDLRALQPYLDGGTALKLRRGALSTRGRLEYDAVGRPQLRYAGDATVSGLHTQDGALAEDFVNWSRLEVRGLEFTRDPARLAIREISARDPYLRLILAANGVTNVLAVLNPEAAARRAAEIAAERAARAEGRRGRDEEGEAQAPAAAPAAPPEKRRMPARIGAIRIANGNVNFTDYTLEPKFAIAIERLGGTVTGMSSAPGDRAMLELAGEVDRYAPASISGEINLLAAQSYLDIAANFRNMELTSFNPYSGKFAGYRIDKGKLSIETRYKVEQRRLTADHRFVIDQLQLGERVESDDAVSLPLKLAVALLKDRNGVIDIDLPVSGSLDDPKFRIGPIVWRALLGLLGKIVTAPFALLGSLFGGGEDLSEIRFSPGSSELDPAAQERAAALRKGLIERPGLQIDIPSTVEPAADREALFLARWGALIAGTGTADRAAYRDRLLELHRERLGGKAEIPKPARTAAGGLEADPVEHAIAFLEPLLQATVAVDEAELAALGEQRAARVRDALLADGAVDPARVFMIRGQPAAPADGAVRMVLSLK
ncbi:MAG TPA: DUF748 domain-containing protein [Steroidobacteraceae bacterium]|nr:DUF748 domain-containing protein [Steroidobacteraceae bacterium]